MIDVTNLFADGSWLLTQLNGNDFLIAAIFASLAVVLKDVPRTIYEFVMRQLTIEITVTNEDDDYFDIVYFIEPCRLKWFTRTFSKKKSSESGLKLDVGYGRSWFWFDHTLGYVDRQFKEVSSHNDLKEEIKVKLLTRNRTKLLNLLAKSIAHKVSLSNTIHVLTTSDGYWSSYGRIPSRSFDSVSIDPADIKRIKAMLDNFLENEEWYFTRGVPYKFGIFIDGAPGTGKSTLVKAIASYLDRDLYFLTPECAKKDEFMLEAVSNFNDRRRRQRFGILVMEELDTFSNLLNREKSENVENNMSSFLSILDGTLTPDNFIFIATTNHADRIDPALKRPGRFDLHITTKVLTLELFCKMISTLYSVDAEVVNADFAEYYHKPATGAQVQAWFQEFKDYKQALPELRKLVSDPNTTL